MILALSRIVSLFVLLFERKCRAVRFTKLEVAFFGKWLFVDIVPSPDVNETLVRRDSCELVMEFEFKFGDSKTVGVLITDKFRTTPFSKSDVSTSLWFKVVISL